MTANFKENKPIYFAVIVYLIWVSVFVGTNYFSEKKRLYNSLDIKLDISAASVPLLLPDNLHNQAMQPEDLTNQQSIEHAHKLSDFTRIRDVIYIYSLVLRDDDVYFTSSSATDEEIEIGDGLASYFDLYDDVDPGVFEVFRFEQKAYLEYTDQWGTFRSVFIPLRSPDGTPYVVAADIEISHIQELLRGSLLKTLGVAALFLLFAIPLVLAFSVASRRLTKQLESHVQKRTEELVNSEGTLNSILELSPVGIVHYDASGRLVKVNREFEAIVGFKRQELLGEKLKECQENAGILRAIDESLAGRRGLFEGEVERDGQKVILHAQFVPMVSTTGTVGGVAVIDDCTVQHETLLNLQKLSMAVENSPNVVFITDKEGAIEYANPRFVEVTGFTAKEAAGKNPRILNSGMNDIEVYENLWSELLKGNHWSGEFQNRRKNGELYWARQNIAPVLDKSNAITHFVAIQEDVTEARRIHEQNAYHATHDMLTGLVNRYEFERRLDRVVDTAKQGESTHAMCFVDLDQFKIINDTCGHVAGDALLRYLSAVLRDKLRVRDTLARIGGDEFALLMEHCNSEQALRVAETMHQIIDEFVFSWEGRNFTIGSSIGLTCIDQNTADAVEVFKRADAACYMAKEQGRNRIHVYYEDDESLAHREGEMQWVNVLKRALDQDDFILYAQVIEATGAGDDSEISYEILVRLRAEDGALVPPGSFLPAAERYNLGAQLDRWVVEHTLAWLESNWGDLKHVHHFAINLSGQSLGDEAFLSYLQHRLHETTIPAGIICFEITETAAIANLSMASQFIRTLREYGCRFSLDDFGSGLSSFAYLKNLPVDYLKIDGMFVKDIIEDPIDDAMVKSINEIGHVMEMMTIGEFVENDAIRDRLKQIGVDFVQGYGVGMPIPLTDILTH